MLKKKSPESSHHFLNDRPRNNLLIHKQDIRTNDWCGRNRAGGDWRLCKCWRTVDAEEY